MGRISTSILPIFLQTENYEIIKLMRKYFDDVKNEAEQKQKEKLNNILKVKQNIFRMIILKKKRYEMMVNIMDENSSDIKMQEIFKQKIDLLLKYKINYIKNY